MRPFAFRFLAVTTVIFMLPILGAIIPGIGFYLFFMALFLCIIIGPAVWAVTLSSAVKLYGRRMWWLLVSAPVALFWPAFLACWIYYAAVGASSYPH